MQPPVIFVSMVISALLVFIVQKPRISSAITRRRCKRLLWVGSHFLPFKTLPHQLPLWVGSSYGQLQEAKFRYPPESGYTIGVIFSETYSCFRPGVAIRPMQKPQLFLTGTTARGTSLYLSCLMLAGCSLSYSVLVKRHVRSTRPVEAAGQNELKRLVRWMTDHFPSDSQLPLTPRKLQSTW